MNASLDNTPAGLRSPFEKALRAARGTLARLHERWPEFVVRHDAVLYAVDVVLGEAHVADFARVHAGARALWGMAAHTLYELMRAGGREDEKLGDEILAVILAVNEAAA